MEWLGAAHGYAGGGGIALYVAATRMPPSTHDPKSLAVDSHL